MSIHRHTNTLPVSSRYLHEQIILGTQKGALPVPGKPGREGAFATLWGYWPDGFSGAGSTDSGLTRLASPLS